jgi:hypothetical protein
MSTATSVSVFTCGSELDAMNPLYHTRFQTLYDTWLKQKLSDAQSGGCWEACVAPTPTTAHSTTHIPDMYRCGKCIHDLVESPQKTAAQQGGGCSLCVDVLAPWAYQQHTTTLPTPEELQTFLQGSTYPDAYQAFQSLPTCERAEWTRAVCGTGTNGTAYKVPLDAASASPPSSDSSISTEGWVGIGVAIVVVLVLLVLALLFMRRQRRTLLQQDNAEVTYNNNNFVSLDDETGSEQDIIPEEDTQTVETAQ